MPLKIKIEEAKRLALELGYSEIIIYGYDENSGIEHVTTYGITKDNCKNAANKGNKIKRTLGWSEEYCNAKPTKTD